MNSLKTDFFRKIQKLNFQIFRKKVWNKLKKSEMKIWTEPKISFLSEGDPTDVTFERSFTLNAILRLKINHFWPITSE